MSSREMPARSTHLGSVGSCSPNIFFCSAGTHDFFGIRMISLIFGATKNMQEEFLHKKINERKEQGAFRRLRIENNMIDFCSNDYLGIARNQLISRAIQRNPDERYKHLNHGSTGSRLLSGNDQMFGELEDQIARFHEAPAALIFS